MHNFTLKSFVSNHFRCVKASVNKFFLKFVEVSAVYNLIFEVDFDHAKFEIFDGNVAGSFTKLDRPTYIEQKWRLRQWPAGHFSTLKIKFEQNNVDAVTLMKVDWVSTYTLKVGASQNAF